MPEPVDEVLIALRRITRAIDLHSRRLIALHGLTVPQVLVLKQLAEVGPLPVGTLSRLVRLSSATVSAMLRRLTSRDLVAQVRSEEDRRVVLVEITEAGRDAIASAPSLLQEDFIEAFSALSSWEQHGLISGLQRIASMMDADNLDAAPFLTPGATMDPGSEQG
ncbi:MAG: MarR family transcriptional regulator [Deltaproteobacteria bacterium]|nr:MarR family transcriptional regulator [Deltaproteobacteria bacterium]